MKDLKVKLGLKEYSFKAYQRLHEVDVLIDHADCDPDARLSEPYKSLYRKAIDILGTALIYADNAEDHLVKARILAMLGFVLFKCLHRTEE